MDNGNKPASIFDEVWQPWTTCPFYWISNLGNVYSCKADKLLTPRIGRDGRYLVVDLRNGNERWYKRVHRLVAETFLPNPDSLPEVNHIDGNRMNNSVTNLEWCTHTENMLHAENTGLVKHPHKLSDEEMEYIRTHYVPNDPEFGTRALGRRFGVSHSQIRYILKGSVKRG